MTLPTVTAHLQTLFIWQRSAVERGNAHRTISDGCNISRTDLSCGKRHIAGTRPKERLIDVEVFVLQRENTTMETRGRNPYSLARESLIGS